MKKMIYIAILLLYPLLGIAQFESGDFGTLRSGEGPNSTNGQDSAKVNVPHVRRAWQWHHQGVYTTTVSLDTLLDGIHTTNYIFKKSISNTYLGNFPSPYESNLFFQRETVQNFYPFTYIRTFLYRPEDAQYFNTTTPFTRLRYFSGGSKGQAENLLDVWHSQNVKPWWNVGMRYNLISGDGRYANQKSKAYHFSIYSTYEKDRTIFTFFLNQNNGNIRENGGIKDLTYITDSTNQEAENMPVWLNGNEARNTYRNTNLNLLTQYHLGKAKEIIFVKDSLNSDTSYIYPAKATFNFRLEDNEHAYKENSINSEFYPNTYIDSIFTLDKIKHKYYEFSTRLVVNEHPKYKYLPGFFVGLDFKHEKYHQRTAVDSIGQHFGNNNYSGTYLTGGMFNIDSTSLLNFDITAKLCFTGHYAGNFKINGYISQALNKEKSTLLRADADIELKSVNPFLNHYIGTHDMWENHFKAIKTIQAKGKYINQKLRTELGIGINNIFSYVYFDTLAKPQQTDKALIVFTAWARENFRLGNFYFDQQVYFQQSSQEDILSLPMLSVYSHNYYQNHLFKRALELQIGVDLYYDTKFYADSYMPSIMQFYNQRKYKTGSYPKIDLFLNLHIKRALLFVKYEHANHILKKNGNYFSAADYPINPSMVKFGLQWDFFD